MSQTLMVYLNPGNACNPGYACNPWIINSEEMFTRLKLFTGMRLYVTAPSIGKVSLGEVVRKGSY